MSSIVLRKTPLVDALVPGTGLLRDSLLITGGAALTFAGAQITIPWEPVPFTLQTMSVMLCGLALGSKRGVLSQLVYVSAGAVGLPVFAQAKFGLHPMMGATGGYLLSFMIVSWLLGALAEKGWTQSIGKTAAAMAIGCTINLGLGAAWLSAFIGWQAAAIHGVVPFLIPEAMKATFVILALPSIWKLVKGQDRN